MIENTSGLKPLGRAVLVRHIVQEKKDSLIVLPDTVSERTMMLEQKAQVIECGPECWKEESAPRAIPGDNVLIARLVGHFATGPLDGKQYRLVNDRDIFAAIALEEDHE